MKEALIQHKSQSFIKDQNLPLTIWQILRALPKIPLAAEYFPKVFSHSLQWRKGDLSLFQI